MTKVTNKNVSWQRERVLKILKTLTPSQKKILKDKKIEGTFIPSKLIKLMKNLAVFDESLDLLRNKLESKKNTFVGLLIASIVLTILSLIVFRNAITLIPIIGIVSFSILYSKSSKEKRKWGEYDLDNSFRNFALPLVGVMNEEIKPSTKFQLEIDSKHILSKSFFVNTVKKTSYYGRTYHNFQADWLKGSLTFFDDSNVEFNSTKYCQRIDITKRSRSGKTKMKTKYKIKEVTIVKIGFQKDKYCISETIPSNIRVEEGENKIIVKAKFVQKSDTLRDFGLNHFLSMMHNMYSTVKPVV